MVSGQLMGAGVPSFPRWVPASLLPPEDPSQSGGVRRTARDWFVDTVLFVAAVGVGIVFAHSAHTAEAGHAGSTLIALDWVAGGLACIAVAGRRRWPVGVAVVTTLASAISAFAVPAAVVGLFTAAVHRRTAVVAPIAVASVATGAIFELVRPQPMSLLANTLINITAIAVVTAWGMFVRARRQLVWTLRARAERAEAEQRLLADQARAAERTRIAREMHDVLAHRISLMALHAGGLQVTRDLSEAQVRETAGLLRSTAQQALEELRGVIGVLREDPDATAGDGSSDPRPAPPQPTLREIPRLVEDTRRAGARIEFSQSVEGEVSDGVGRDAYRIVQEALTNVAKHARGTATSVQVTGSPEQGLRVTVRNRLPVGAAVGPVLPGSGAGLLGLRERVGLAGGRITHGPTADGEFVVDALLSW